MMKDPNDMARQIEEALRPFRSKDAALPSISQYRCPACKCAFYGQAQARDTCMCLDCQAKAPSFLIKQDPLAEAEKRLHAVVTIADLAQACSWMLAELRQLRVDKARAAEMCEDR